MKRKIRILLADDHMLLRMGLSSLIMSEKDMEVIGEADNGREAVILARKLRPDVVIMDLMMPELSGAQATRLICNELPEVKVMILSSFGTSFDMAQAITNGAACALTKDTTSEHLADTIRAIHNGKKIIPPHLLKMAEEESYAPQLTHHQLDLLALMTRGLSNPDIARRFNVSEITIKKRLTTLFNQIGAANRTEAVAIALRKQLVKI